ncbi:MAG TPA: tetratricopeptide repeat protein, partial [Candidatus Sulfotelmatobacter sp.]|nr:tetratricopeptide repeat protein [Candidatus Sulfotelmatobacter sp.]
SRDREAVVLFEEALEAARALGAAWLLATSLMNLGVAVMHAGETRRARGLLGEAVDLYAQLGDRVFMARARVHLAQSHLLDGNVAEAEALFRDCLVQLRRAGERMDTAEALEGLAATAAARGAMRRTPLLLGAAAALRETEGSRQHPFDARISERFTGPLRELAGPSAWEAGLAEGRRMPLDKLPES